ncbi:MAG: ABC transporter permease [Bacteroidetes bacterium]|nr:ABC transporter permease [Bacteroidota bacterium]
MNNLLHACGVELLKARRSKVPLFTALGFSLAPLAGGFFMIVLKDPVMARDMGLISTKAQIFGGTADWPAYFGMLAQAAAVGGMVLFSFVASWVFGREFSDRTIKDLLALPTPRRSIVLAKFVVVALWALFLTLIVIILGLGIGALVGLPGAGSGVFLQGILRITACAGLTLITVTPVAFFAGVGRGYLAPTGMAILLLVCAQLVGATGWGEYFPWSIAALYSGAAGPASAQLSLVSLAIVLITGILGLVATIRWWERADQTR